MGYPKRVLFKLYLDCFKIIRVSKLFGRVMKLLKLSILDYSALRLYIIKITIDY
jgi:hypothetical protein